MDQKWYVGIDIGGTKSSVLLINEEGKIFDRKQMPTTKGKDNWRPTVNFFIDGITEYLKQKDIISIGISCGGPLNTNEGVICSPPNLLPDGMIFQS